MSISAPRPVKRVLVSGATGFIGPKLVRSLRARGARVVAYVRDTAKARRLLGPEVDVVADLAGLPRAEHLDAVVNLAGAPIAGAPWTKRRRALLLESRLGVTHALLELTERLDTKPSTWVNASAIGYYGARAGDEPVDEQTPPGTGFQAELCRRWEEAAAQAAAQGIAVSFLRFGVVLGRDGGALPAYARPVRLFVGAVIGTGRQWISWIHIDDLVDLVSFVIERETLTCAINATSPSPARHAELMAAIAATLKRPLWPLRVPSPLVRAALGELAELFVDGQRVVPRRALELGYRFRHPELSTALRDLFVGVPTAKSVSGSR